MKKYVVICYAVHKKEIASHDAFDNEDDRYDSDDDYAAGVDDAMDEDYEEW